MEDDSYVGAVLDDTREKMAKALEHTLLEFGAIRTGRAAPALVEKLRVDYYCSNWPASSRRRPNCSSSPRTTRVR
jgi:ribosome recycling factor